MRFWCATILTFHQNSWREFLAGLPHLSSNGGGSRRKRGHTSPPEPFPRCIFAIAGNLVEYSIDYTPQPQDSHMRSLAILSLLIMATTATAGQDAPPAPVPDVAADVAVIPPPVIPPPCVDCQPPPHHYPPTHCTPPHHYPVHCPTTHGYKPHCPPVKHCRRWRPLCRLFRCRR